MTIENPRELLEAVHATGDFGSEPNRGYDETLLDRRDGAGIHIRSGRTSSDTWETIDLIGPHENTLFSLVYIHGPGETRGYLDYIRVDVLDTQKISDDHLEYLRKEYHLRDGGWLFADKSLLKPKYYRNLKDSGYYLYEEDVRRDIDMHATAALFFAKISGWMANPESFDTADLKSELVPATP